MTDKKKIMVTFDKKFWIKVVLIDDGRIVDVGSPKKILPKLNSKVLHEDSDDSESSKSKKEIFLSSQS